MLFIWLGGKMMIIASEIGAKSYEDLNIALFGDRYGKWISHFMLIVLLGVTAVMLAGAGTIFMRIGISRISPVYLSRLAPAISCYAKA